METDNVLEENARLAAAGDRAALEKALAGVQPLVMARCRRFFPNEYDAQDAAQEALLKISRRIDSFDGRSKFTTWAYRVTSNSAIDTYRTLKRRRSVLSDPPEHRASGSTPSVIAGSRIDVLEAVEELGEKVTEPVLLRDLCELEYAEIASMLDLPLGTLKRRIHEGRNQMRRVLRDRPEIG